MKLQTASKKEIKRIAIGSGICLLVMLGVFFLLSCFQIVSFDYRLILGGIMGTGVAVANFTVLCLTIQKAAATQDQKLMKARFQFSYNARLILQAGWVIGAFLLPWVNVVAAALPLLFPTAVIWFLQSRGRLVTPSQRKNPPAVQEEEEERLDTLEG